MDNSFTMDSPVLPDCVLRVLETIKTEEKQLTSWKVQDDKNKMSLTLVWMRKTSKQPARKIKRMTKPPPHPVSVQVPSSRNGSSRTGKNGTLIDCNDGTPVSKDSCSTSKIITGTGNPSVLTKDNNSSPGKKAPSRLRRDRQRLLQFRKKKCEQKLKEKLKNAKNSKFIIHHEKDFISQKVVEMDFLPGHVFGATADQPLPDRLPTLYSCPYADQTILDVRQHMLLQLQVGYNIKLCSSQLRINQISASTSAYNLDDNVPVSSIILNKTMPHYSLSYDICYS